MNLSMLLNNKEINKIFMDEATEIALEKEKIVEDILQANKEIKEISNKLFSHMEIESIKGNITEELIEQYEIEYSNLLNKYNEEVVENTKEFEREYIEGMQNINNVYNMVLKVIATKKAEKLSLFRQREGIRQMLKIAHEAHLDEIRDNDSFESLSMLNASIENIKSILNTEIEEQKLQEILIHLVEENISETESIRSKIRKLNFRYKDLIEIARTKGFEITRFHGSHAILKNDENKVVVIPNKPGTAPKGLQYTILKSVY